MAWHEFTHDQRRLEELVARQLPGPLRRFQGAAAAGARSFLNVRFGVKSADAAEEARGRVLAALDRLESELDGRDYLVGDGFTIADLTAAALFYPLIQPPEGPRLPGELPEAFERFRAPLEERPAYRWVADTYRRHRKRAGAYTAGT